MTDSRYIFPEKLKRGDRVAIISPSYSFKKIPVDVVKVAKKRFEEIGLELVFGKHLSEMDGFESSPIASRIDDFDWAFQDSSIKGILASSGGYNSNFLLNYIKWDLVKRNPKFFCGMSDVTVLANAITAKTGLVTYSGPNFRNFGQEKHFQYTFDYFKKIAFGEDPIELRASEFWSDDRWSKDQEKRKLINNQGWLVIKEGGFEGRVVGGNLCSLNLLQGTKYMPSLKNRVLFIEDDEISTAGEYSRNLQSLAHLPEFSKIRGLVLGRFQKKTKMKNEMLVDLIGQILDVAKFPIIANLDFGHTDPKFTFPIGGYVNGVVKKGASRITIKNAIAG